MPTRIEAAISAVLISLAVLGIGTAQAATGRDRPARAPEHALQRSYGGWECDRGYRAEGNGCIKIVLPEHAYLTDDNRQMPGWKCDRGYRVMASGCAAIKIPENGFLTEDTFGSGWKCLRGFRIEAQSCLPLVIPANAHIDNSGNDWTCTKPHRRAADGCRLEEKAELR